MDNNLSKLKKQDLINKKAGKTMSSEKDLADELGKGDKSFTDHTSTESDVNYGGKMKIKPHNPKFATTSKTDPANGKLDAEKDLSKLKGDTKFKDMTSTEADNKIKNDHSKKSGSGKTSADISLSKSNFKKASKSAPSSKKLDAEDFLSDNFTHLMNFGQFLNENFKDENEEVKNEDSECATCGEKPCNCDDKDDKK